MDVETWNALLGQMYDADQRSQRMMALSAAIDPLAAEARALGVEFLAAELDQLRTDAFTLAAMARARAGELERQLEETRDAGEERD
jgi:hypothetical protein